MKAFVYRSLPSGVLFGSGRLTELPGEVAALGVERALLISTRREGLGERVAELLGGRCAGLIDRVSMHVPRESVDRALVTLRASRPDGLVAVGGGSVIGLAKALALEAALPIVAVPTTYSGSESTPIWGITSGGRKTTGRDASVQPRTVIYDVDLTLEMPARLAATSGTNALAHCVEALYAENGNPVTALLAEEGARALVASLPSVVARPGEREARGQAQYGAFLASVALGAVGMALHHKLAHVLAGDYDLPHGDVHSVLLPHAVAFNASHAPTAMEALGRALGVEPANVAEALFDLGRELGTPGSLAEVGMRAGDLDEAARSVVERPYFNPRPVSEREARELLEDAYRGIRPRPG